MDREKGGFGWMLWYMKLNVLQQTVQVQLSLYCTHSARGI